MKNLSTCIVLLGVVFLATGCKKKVENALKDCDQHQICKWRLEILDGSHNGSPFGSNGAGIICTGAKPNLNVVVNKDGVKRTIYDGDFTFSTAGVSTDMDLADGCLDADYLSKMKLDASTGVNRNNLIFVKNDSRCPGQCIVYRIGAENIETSLVDCKLVIKLKVFPVKKGVSGVICTTCPGGC